MALGNGPVNGNRNQWAQIRTDNDTADSWRDRSARCPGNWSRANAGPRRCRRS